jgi:hypothetical protein
MQVDLRHHARMAIPVVVSCPCGEQVRGSAGEVLQCPSCGRRHETDGVPIDDLRAAAAVVTRHRIATRLGTGVVGLVTVLLFVRFGWAGFLAGILGGGAAVYAGFLPWWRRRLVRGLNR